MFQLTKTLKARVGFGGFPERFLFKKNFESVVLAKRFSQKDFTKGHGKSWGTTAKLVWDYDKNGTWYGHYMDADGEPVYSIEDVCGEDESQELYRMLVSIEKRLKNIEKIMKVKQN